MRIGKKVSQFGLVSPAFILSELHRSGVKVADPSISASLPARSDMSDVMFV